MPRKPRIDYENAWHHITNRGARRTDIFLGDKDAQLFLDTLGDTYDRFGMEVHSYCLMSNHFHLLVRSVNGKLSDSMQHLGSRYAQVFDKIHNVGGPLFQSRFYNKIIASDEQLLTTSRYIHRNPVEAHMTSVADHYTWSSQRFFVEPQRAHPWLKRDVILRIAGGPAAYEGFVNATFPSDKRAA